jgi:hypothetical protein
MPEYTCILAVTDGKFGHAATMRLRDAVVELSGEHLDPGQELDLGVRGDGVLGVSLRGDDLGADDAARIREAVLDIAQDMVSDLTVEMSVFTQVDAPLRMRP